MKAVFYTVWSLTSSTLEVVRNEDSQAPLRSTELETLEVESSNLCFQKLPRYFRGRLKLEPVYTISLTTEFRVEYKSEEQGSKSFTLSIPRRTRPFECL